MYVLSSPLRILGKLLTQSSILPFSLSSSVLVYRSVLSHGYDLISHIAVPSSQALSVNCDRPDCPQQTGKIVLQVAFTP